MTPDVVRASPSIKPTNVSAELAVLLPSYSLVAAAVAVRALAVMVAEAEVMSPVAKL